MRWFSCSGKARGKDYTADLDFFAPVDPKDPASKYDIKPRSVQVRCCCNTRIMRRQKSDHGIASEERRYERASQQYALFVSIEIDDNNGGTVALIRCELLTVVIYLRDVPVFAVLCDEG